MKVALLLCAAAVASATTCNSWTTDVDCTHDHANTTEVTCDANTYYWGQFQGSNYCVKCPAGTASTGCTGCTEDKTGSVCKPVAGIVCPVGKFVLVTNPANGERLSSCSDCPAGKWQSKETQNSCFQCPKGMFQPSAGFNSCYSCPLGKFQTAAGSTSCDSCSDCNCGSKAVTTATQSTTSDTCGCAQCGKGEYTVSGHASCYDCPIGRYNDADAACTCKFCPAGKYGPGTRLESCTDCESGKWSHEGAEDSTDCTESSQSKYKCPAGRYIMYWNPTKTLYCLYCPSGRYGEIKDGYDYGGICKHCAAGTFQPAEGKTSCDDCAGNMTSDYGSTICVPPAPTPHPTVPPTGAPTPAAYDCVLSNWMGWSQCTVPCGGGTKSDHKIVLQYDKHGGSVCQATSRTASCNTDVCGTTAAPTAAPTAYPTATPTKNPTKAPTKNPTKAPYACTVGDWGAWSSCSATCGPSSRIQVRTVTEHGLDDYVCPPLEQQESCNKPACPTDFPTASPTDSPTKAPTAFPTWSPTASPTVESTNCAVGQWTAWSLCDVTCGGGSQTRTRVVVNEAEQTQYHVDYQACPDLTKTRNCAEQACPTPAPTHPVDCVESEWTIVGDTCPNCVQSLTPQIVTNWERHVLIHPHSGGQTCGALTKTEDCTMTICPEDCTYTEGAWSACSLTCGIVANDGKQTRTITVTSAAQGTGAACPNPLEQEQACTEEDVACPVDCVLGGWMQDTQCTRTCGNDATYTETRSVNQQQVGAGAPCGETLRVLPCNRFSCPIDCTVGGWGSLGDCSVSCGTGTRTKTRQIVTGAYHGGEACPPLSDSTTACHTDCPVHCEVTNFNGEWSECTKSCGGGTHTQSRSVITAPLHGGNACPPLDKVQDCNPGQTASGSGLRFCPFDCVYTEWAADWTTCDRSCGGGKKIKRRSVSNHPRHGGKACPSLEKEEACHEHACPEDCFMSQYTDWSECSASCGNGTQTSTRIILHPAANGGKACEDLSAYGGASGATKKTRECRDRRCEVHCTVTAWTTWNSATCDKSCGGGTHYRTRTIVTEANWGGDVCPHLSESSSCNTHSCPVDCDYDTFGDWEPCSTSCGTGTQIKHRHINRRTQYGGKVCPPVSTTQACNTAECPIHCEMSDFPAWGNCTEECGGGTKTTTRTVNVPAMYNGVPCPTQNTKTMTCNTQACPVDCVSTYDDDWSRCSKTCGHGEQFKQRSISVYPRNGGVACPQATLQQACNEFDCATDCVMDAWPVSFTACSETCGGGKKTKTRGYTDPATHGGKACGPTEISVDCNEHACPVDCAVTAWDIHWGPCSVTCGGGGVEKKGRTIVHQDAYGGKACPDIVKQQNCGSGACPVHCEVDNWVQEDCMRDGSVVTCGGGQYRQHRQIVQQVIGTGNVCPHLEEFVACATDACPIDCVQAGWGDYSTCTKTCGTGGQKYRQNPITTHPKHGGQECDKIEEVASCNGGVTYCPIDCVEGSWTQDNGGACSADCGGGSITYTRSPATSTAFGGKACGASTKSEECNAHPCPINCEYYPSAYGAWGECTASCGGGKRYRHRSISQNGLFNGTACDLDSLEQEETCSPDACPIDCVAQTWSSWTACSVTCGSAGTQTRTRTVDASIPASHPCPHLASENRACNEGPCPIDCDTSEWSALTACTKTCGGGVQYQTRSIITADQHNGQECGNLVEQLACGAANCPVDCRLGAWSDWDACTHTCGTGTRQRTRNIMESPTTDGVQCEVTSATEECNTRNCPIDCDEGAWGGWTTCTHDCGKGRQSRLRSITTPAAYGGVACAPMTEDRFCNDHACPVDCVLSDWHAWDLCDKPCGTGERRRTKTVTTVASGGGAACSTDDFETEPCNPQQCPIDCAVSPWIGQNATGGGDPTFTACSSSCAGGTQFTYRTITTAAALGGTECPKTIMYQDCNTHPCPVDCQLSAWTQFDTCSITCGASGTQTRTRTRAVPSSLGGKSCPDSMLTHTQACYNGHCPVDCTTSSWTKAESCRIPGGNGAPVTCGAAAEAKWTRSVLTQNTNGGSICGDLEEQRSCGFVECPIDCVTTPWVDSVGCDATCGGAYKTQTRSITTVMQHLGTPCPSDMDRSIACQGGVDAGYADNCPIDCVLQWYDALTTSSTSAGIGWSDCSEPCGNSGIKTKTATETQAPMHSGAACDPFPISEECNRVACTDSPTASPTAAPTAAPTDFPTAAPTAAPTEFATCTPGATHSVTLTATSGTFSFPAEGPWDITATYGSGNAGSCALDIEQAAASSWYTVTSSTFGFLARDAQYTFSEEGCTVTLAAVCSGVRTDCVPETTFGAFGACSASCGGGTMTATRSVITEASHGGDACVLTRTETCNEDPCPWSGCYQAEDGYLANGATFETANSGAMGTGYVHFQKDPNEELWWKVNVPTNGRYNLVFRYNTEGTGASSSDSHGLQVQTVEGCALNIDNKYSEVISFPASTSWAETSMNVDLRAGINTVKIVTHTQYGPNLDQVCVTKTHDLSRCTPGTVKSLAWGASATTGASSFVAQGLAYHSTSVSDALAGYIDLDELGPWNVKTNFMSSKENGGANTENDYVTAYANGKNVGRFVNGELGEIAGSAAFKVRTASIQYRFDFESSLGGAINSNTWKYHMAVQNGNATCGGCSHVTCAIENHKRTNSSRIVVRHSGDEMYGNQHHCAMESDGTCHCECSSDNTNSDWTAITSHRNSDGTLMYGGNSANSHWGNDGANSGVSGAGYVKHGSNGFTSTHIGSSSAARARGRVIGSDEGTLGLPTQRTTNLAGHDSATYQLQCTEMNGWEHEIKTAGWATCAKSGQYLTGLLKHHCSGGLHCTTGAQCCDTTVSALKAQTCETPAWTLSAAHESVQCSDGYFLTAIERSKCNSLYCIKKAKCCKNAGAGSWVSQEWKAWWADNSNPGWMSCPAGKFMAGLKRGACDDVRCLSEVLCVN